MERKDIVICVVAVVLGGIMVFTLFGRKETNQPPEQVQVQEDNVQPEPTPNVMPEKSSAVVKISLRDFQDALAEIDYSVGKLLSGDVNEISPTFVIRISQKAFDEDAISFSSRVFYRLFLPFVLSANKDLFATRKQLIRLVAKRERIGILSPSDLKWLRELALKYKVTNSLNSKITDEMLRLLTLRVDIIPPSIILAEAAYQSRFGTTFTAGGGSIKYSLAKDLEDIHPDESVLAYAMALNAEPAYWEFRKMRSAARDENNTLVLDGYALVLGLKHASMKGMDYVRELQGIMKARGLQRADGATLRNTSHFIVER